MKGPLSHSCTRFSYYSFHGFLARWNFFVFPKHNVLFLLFVLSVHAHIFVFFSVFPFFAIIFFFVLFTQSFFLSFAYHFLLLCSHKRVTFGWSFFSLFALIASAPSHFLLHPFDFLLLLLLLLFGSRMCPVNSKGFIYISDSFYLFIYLTKVFRANFAFRFFSFTHSHFADVFHIKR